MNVTFINPNMNGAVSINIGLAYVLSAAAKSHRVRLLDMSFHPHDYLAYTAREIARDLPDVVGFSVSSYNFKVSLDIAAEVRKLAPRARLVFGGVHPTLLPDDTLAHPLVDAVCIGEGEDAFPAYLDMLARGETGPVAGMWFKRPDGTVERSPLRPFREDIDAFPFPDWDHWGIDTYLDFNVYALPGALHVLGSRGCPYDCSFCSNVAVRETVPGRFFRVRSPRNVIEEIVWNRDRYRGRSFKSIYFADELFGLDVAALEEFCSLYRKEGLHRDIRWICSTRANLVTDRWAAAVAAAGCRVVNIGVESGDDTIRTQVYKKKVSRAHIAEAVRHLRNHGVGCGFLMMVGCPQDTRETIRESVRLVNELDPCRAYFSVYQPLPRTELAAQIDDGMWEYDRTLVKQGNIPRIRTRSLTARQLRRIMWGIRLGELWRFLKMGFRMKGLGFPLDIVTFVLSLDGRRKMPLTSPHVKPELEQKTIYKYLIEQGGRRAAAE